MNDVYIYGWDNRQGIMMTRIGLFTLMRSFLFYMTATERDKNTLEPLSYVILNITVYTFSSPSFVPSSSTKRGCQQPVALLVSSYSFSRSLNT